MSREAPAKKVSADVSVPEVSAARTLFLQKSPPKDNNCQRHKLIMMFEPAYIGTPEFDFDPSSGLLDQRMKTVKTDKVVECLICHVTLKRIDCHLKQHRDKICGEERFLIDFYRTRNAPKSKQVSDCVNC